MTVGTLSPEKVFDSDNLSFVQDGDVWRLIDELTKEVSTELAD